MMQEVVGYMSWSGVGAEERMCVYKWVWVNGLSVGRTGKLVGEGSPSSATLLLVLLQLQVMQGVPQGLRCLATDRAARKLYSTSRAHGG